MGGGARGLPLGVCQIMLDRAGGVQKVSFCEDVFDG